MEKPYFAFAVILVLMVFVAGTANASTSYSFSGSVYAVDQSLGSNFSTGQTVTGSYTVDELTGGQTYGDWTLYQNALTSFSATIGGYTVSFGNNNRIDVLNGGAYDRYIVTVYNPSGVVVENMPVSYFFFSLDDNTGTILSNGSLPLSGSVLNSFASKAGVLAFGNGDGNRVTFSVDIITPVPIPGAAGLLGSSLLGLIGLSRRRQSAS